MDIDFKTQIQIFFFRVDAAKSIFAFLSRFEMKIDKSFRNFQPSKMWKQILKKYFRFIIFVYNNMLNTFAWLRVSEISFKKISTKFRNS